MTHEQERQAIVAAMGRLLAGTPERSSGNLDIVSLAAEAGLKRNKLTHKHTDLRDQFYAERAQREGVSQREIRLRENAVALQEQIATLREDRDNYRIASEVFARAINVLTAENQELRKQLATAAAGRVTPLRRS
jgi:hypothetical protein